MMSTPTSTMSVCTKSAAASAIHAMPSLVATISAPTNWHADDDAYGKRDAESHQADQEVMQEGVSLVACGGESHEGFRNGDR